MNARSPLYTHSEFALVGRRTFLKGAAAALTSARLAHAWETEPVATAPVFSTANQRWQDTYEHALAVLAANVQVLPRFDRPVLIEGASYAGIWQECGPHEALVYRQFRPDLARNAHLTFFALQRPDGQLPANNKRSEAGFGQIQMTVPIAATAWELAQATGDAELLSTAYAACARWDAWLLRYRNTRGTGLVEGFCTYDTGHDNSPRWAGMPNQCPGKDARQCPPLPSLPRLCPDLSATVFSARLALAAMASALGKRAEADRWTESAEQLRGLILSRLYVPEDAAFYDLDAQNHFVKVRSDILSRMCGEHVVDQATFDSLWRRQIGDPHAFWAPYPLPSVALDDAAFVRPIPRNSWGGASQALTALRAGRWFDHYGRSAEFSSMMDPWCEAMLRDGTFRQQMDPLSGDFTAADLPSYSPAALVMMDYTWRLAGVREEPDALHWNVRPGHPASDRARFHLSTDAGRRAELSYSAASSGEVRLDGRVIARMTGGAARLLTSKSGQPQSLLGIHKSPQHVTLQLASGKPRRYVIAANARVPL